MAGDDRSKDFATDDEIVGALPAMRAIVRARTQGWPRGKDTDDAYAVGALAVVEAARRWCRRRGVPFKSYIRRRVIGALLDVDRVRNLTAPGSSDYPVSEQVSLNLRAGTEDDDDEVGDAIADPGPSVAEIAARHETGRLLRERIARLKPSRRRALGARLGPYGGLARLADERGVSRSTVAATARTAQAKIVKDLEPLDEDDDEPHAA